MGSEAYPNTTMNFEQLKRHAKARPCKPRLGECSSECKPSSKRSISSGRYWAAILASTKESYWLWSWISYLRSFAGQGGVIDYPHDDFTTKEGIVMSHLMLTRRAGQSIVLNLAPDAGPEKALLQFLRDGITVEIRQIESGSVRVSIDAPRTIQILRNELIHP